MRTGRSTAAAIAAMDSSLAMSATQAITPGCRLASASMLAALRVTATTSRPAAHSLATIAWPKAPVAPTTTANSLFALMFTSQGKRMKPISRSVGANSFA
ncbi:hypothetical protein D3C78_1506930 [compost metagenome]